MTVAVERLAGIGNAATFDRQTEILLDGVGGEAPADSDLLYWAEDDYFYLPGALDDMVGLMRAHPEVDFATPYDHPDYVEHPLHQEPHDYRRETAHAGRCWRTVASTCCTFLARRDTAARARPYLALYRRYSDRLMWQEMTRRPTRDAGPLSPRERPDRRTYALWAPQGSCGTHLYRSLLSRERD